MLYLLGLLTILYIKHAIHSTSISNWFRNEWVERGRARGAAGVQPGPRTYINSWARTDKSNYSSHTFSLIDTKMDVPLWSILKVKCCIREKDFFLSQTGLYVTDFRSGWTIFFSSRELYGLQFIKRMIHHNNNFSALSFLLLLLWKKWPLNYRWP